MVTEGGKVFCCLEGNLSDTWQDMVRYMIMWSWSNCSNKLTKNNAICLHHSLIGYVLEPKSCSSMVRMLCFSSMFNHNGTCSCKHWLYQCFAAFPSAHVAKSYLFWNCSLGSSNLVCMILILRVLQQFAKNVGLFFFQDHLAAARGSRKWSKEQWACSDWGNGGDCRPNGRESCISSQPIRLAAWFTRLVWVGVIECLKGWAREGLIHTVGRRMLCCIMYI